MKIIVIKVGTNVLTNNKQGLSKKIIKQISQQIAWLYKQGYQPVLITSGAMGAGRGVVSLDIKDRVVARSVLAGVGQAHLMNVYNSELIKYKIKTAQFLLTREDFALRDHYLNLQKALVAALENNILPIINENDVVSTYELTFGDNDRLAANVAITLAAKYLMILTNLEGLYSEDPKKNSQAKLINEVKNVNQQIEKYCSKEKSSQGMGGMSSKLSAIKLAMKAGVNCLIINGLKPNIIKHALVTKKVGTKFLASSKTIKDRERWLMTSTAMAQIMVDDGAKKALRTRKSLLLVGVRKIQGNFVKREIVEIVDGQQNIIGYGVVNFSAMVLEKHLPQPKSLNKEIIHANNITLL